MKKTLILALVFSCFSALSFAQQDKSKRPSPPAKVSETIASGATITIDYSQPALKGRSIGKNIAEYGKVWRTGANEATVFEVNKDVTVEGKALKAGKYSLYTIPGENEWTIIFNKTWNQWGTNYKQADDALRVTAKPSKASNASERMTFNIDKSGTVSLLWGNEKVDFKVK